VLVIILGRRSPVKFRDRLSFGFALAKATCLGIPSFSQAPLIDARSE
jgi:hypothetical protein